MEINRVIDRVGNSSSLNSSRQNCILVPTFRRVSNDGSFGQYKSKPNSCSTLQNYRPIIKYDASPTPSFRARSRFVNLFSSGLFHRSGQRSPTRLEFKKCEIESVDPEKQQVRNENKRVHGDFALSDVSLCSLAIFDASAIFPGELKNFLGENFSDLFLMVIFMACAFVWVKLFDELGRRNILDSMLSRKLVHISIGLLYLLSWPFYSDSPHARYFSAMVPTLNILRLVGLGTGMITDPASVRSISRQGDRRELLRGPLYYVIALTLLTIVYWRDSPVCPISFSLMCAGDGIADIVGRKYGSEKLPWNKKKSWLGSIAMFVFGSSVAFLSTYLFGALGYYQFEPFSMASTILIVSSICTIMESLPLTDLLDDNFVVPAFAFVLSSVLFSVKPFLGF